MYKNILIPVILDDSRDASASIEAAKALADKDAHFTLLHVIETVPVYVAEYIPADFMRSARKTVQEVLEEMAQELPGSRVAIADGQPGPRIVRWGEENGSDCIVIASHQPKLSDILLGSVAHHVVRHAKCAVHVVR